MNRFQKEYQEAFALIQKSGYILIVTHINPDADTISCALALSSYMESNRIKHKVFNRSKSCPLSLNFLPNFSKIVNQLPTSYDLVIYVDCGEQNRIGVEVDKNCQSINIDHHQSNNNYATINIVDHHKGSTAEVLFGFFEQNNLKITKNIATCLYLGIYDDSIAFTTPRTDANSFKVVSTLLSTGISPSEILQQYSMRESLAKYRLLPKILDSLELHFEGRVATIYQKYDWLEITGASFNECDEVVNEILKISIVEVAIYLREDKEAIRVSLRGKSGFLNLSKFASIFQGGGHQNAAGLTLEGNDLVAGKNKILEAIRSYI